MELVSVDCTLRSMLIFYVLYFEFDFGSPVIARQRRNNVSERTIVEVKGDSENLIIRIRS